MNAPIATYRALLELGRGGMGVVHLARASGAAGFERLVVIKRMHAHLLAHAEAQERFLHEAHLASNLHHANVVGVQHVGQDDDGYFLVLDYVEGGSLEGLVDRMALRGELLPPPIVLRIALDALSGLQAAHEARDDQGRPLTILHRDVSLQNILVGRDGVSRVADFGVAKSALASVSTDQSYLVGKLLYVPPEHLRREAPDPSFDIYSLGLTMWLALTGTEPWPGADEAQLVTLILEGRLPPPSSTGLQIAPQLEDVIARACAPDRRQRYRSAHDMIEAIENIGRHTGWIASHGEVAEVVAGLLDPDLARLRARIREASVAGVMSTSDAAATSVMVRSGSDQADRRESPSGGRGLQSTLVVGVLLVGLVAAAAATLWWRGRSDAESVSAPNNGTPPSSWVPVASSVAPIPSMSSAGDAEPMNQPDAADIPAPAKVKIRSTTSGPRHAPPPRDDAGKPPDGIIKSNPYR